MLLMTLILALGNARVPKADRSPRMRERVLRRALDVIETQLDAPPSMRELCRLCGTSWPTLYRAFIDRFGVGPKAYSKVMRLNRVRYDLVAAAPDERVADIANRWGFWHMGEFAKDYGKMFSRRPSEDRTVPGPHQNGLSDPLGDVPRA